MVKLTTYKNRKTITGEYKMVSLKTKEYDLVKLYHGTKITEEDATKILRWLARSCNMKLVINFRNCRRSWGGLRRRQPFVTIARRGETKVTSVGVIIHEFAHAHNYYLKSGYNHNDDFIRILDKYIKKFHNSKAKEIVEIKNSI